MSTYIKLSTLEYPRHIGDIEIDPAGMADYALVEWVDQPSFNKDRERCFVGQPIQENGAWKTNWVIQPIPDSEEAVKVRADRNQRLKDSDWSRLDDVNVNKLAWADYRQTLRDIPQQAGFPWDIQWPSAPE
jgi:hypothetical protein